MIGSEFQGIAQQVENNLIQHVDVKPNGGQFVSYDQPQINLALSGIVTETVDDFFKKILQMIGAGMQLKFLMLYLAVVHQLVYQPQQAVYISMDQIQLPAGHGSKLLIF